MAAAAPILPDSWQWAFLENVSKVVSGNPAPQGADKFDDGGIPFVRVQDMGRLGSKIRLQDTKDHITQETAQKLRLFPAGSVLCTKSGASTLLNQRAILDSPMCVVSHIAVAIPEEGILSEWLYFYLSTVDFGNYAHGANMPSMPLSKLRAISIPIAPTAEQIRIVDALNELLSDLNAGVSALERAWKSLYRAGSMLETGQTLRRAILHRAFSGKLVPQRSDDDLASALLTRIEGGREAQTKYTATGREANRRLHNGNFARRGRPRKTGPKNSA